MVWSIVVTRHNQEDKTIEALNQLQLGSRLFKLRKEVVQKGVVIQKLLPAFPRYVFVEPKMFWRRILDLPSVITFVKSSIPSFDEDEPTDEAAPAIIADEVVLSLEKRSDHEFILFDETNERCLIKRFQFGDRVRITNKYNPFAIHPATYLGKDQITINLLGRVTVVNVDEAELELVERPSKRKRRGGRRAFKKRRQYAYSEAGSEALQ